MVQQRVEWLVERLVPARAWRRVVGSRPRGAWAQQRGRSYNFVKEIQRILTAMETVMRIQIQIQIMRDQMVVLVVVQLDSHRQELQVVTELVLHKQGRGLNRN